MSPRRGLSAMAALPLSPSPDPGEWHRAPPRSPANPAPAGSAPGLSPPLPPSTVLGLSIHSFVRSFHVLGTQRGPAQRGRLLNGCETTSYPREPGAGDGSGRRSTGHIVDFDLPAAVSQAAPAPRSPRRGGYGALPDEPAPRPTAFPPGFGPGGLKVRLGGGSRSVGGVRAAPRPSQRSLGTS